MPDDTQHAAVVESLKTTASELQARAHEDMNDDWADRMADGLAAAGLLAAPQQPEIPGPERDLLCKEAKELGLAAAYLERRGETTWIRAARVVRAVHNHLPGRAPIGLREAKVLGEAIAVAFEDNGPAAPADDEAFKRLERKLDTLRAIAQGVSSGADDMRKEIDNVTRALAALREGKQQ